MTHSYSLKLHGGLLCLWVAGCYIFTTSGKVDSGFDPALSSKRRVTSSPHAHPFGKKKKIHTDQRRREKERGKSREGGESKKARWNSWILRREPTKDQTILVKSKLSVPVGCFGGGHSRHLIRFYLEPNFTLTCFTKECSHSILSSYKSNN